MKKKLWTLALIAVFSLSMNASAQEKTVTEKYWDNFQKTIEIKQEQGQGKLNMNGVIIRESDDNFFQPYDYYQMVYGTDVEYGVAEDVQMDLSVYRSNYMDPKFNLYSDNDFDMTGSVKAKLWDDSGMTIYGKGTASAEVENYVFGGNRESYQDLHYNLGLAVDKELNDQLSMHSSANLNIYNDRTQTLEGNTSEWGASQNISNGLAYQVDEGNALKGSVKTTFSNGNVTNDLNLMYKNTNLERVTFLTHFNNRLGSKDWTMVNDVEVKMAPGLALTGEYIWNTAAKDWVALNLQAEKDKLLVKVGTAMSIGGEVNELSVFGDAKYQLNDQMSVTAGFVSSSSKVNPERTVKSTGVQAGVGYDL